MSGVAETAFAAGRSIGRYFSVVAVLPALALVSWVVILVSMGAWEGPVEPANAARALTSLSLTTISALVLAALVLGVIVNPFQFAATQVLEGYWPGGSVASRLAASRINHYRRKLRSWELRTQAAEQEMIKGLVGEPGLEDLERSLVLAREELDGRAGDRYIRLDQVSRYGWHLARTFPPQAGRILPTRLGNTLRASEDRVGRQYGLDAPTVAGHLSLLGQNPRSQYVADTRTSMDLAIRVCLMGLLATPATAALLANDGAWVLLVFVPYSVAYLGYRGAVSAASGYGNAVAYQVDLDRFSLYATLRVKRPNCVGQERQQNRELMPLLRGDPDAEISYAVDSDSSAEASHGEQ